MSLDAYITDNPDFHTLAVLPRMTSPPTQATITDHSTVRKSESG
jgi:hypothetical protein